MRELVMVIIIILTCILGIVGIEKRDLLIKELQEQIIILENQIATSGNLKRR